MISKKRLLDGPGGLILSGWRQADPKVVRGVAEVQAIEPVACMFPSHSVVRSIVEKL